MCRGGVRLAHVSLAFNTHPGHQLQGVLGREDLLVPGGTNPVLGEELSGGITERSLLLNGVFVLEGVSIKVTVGLVGQVP